MWNKFLDATFILHKLDCLRSDNAAVKRQLKCALEVSFSPASWE